MRKAIVGAAVAASLVVGCGGGSDDPLEGWGEPPPPANASGLWVGKTNTDRTLTGLVLSNGTYYVLYSVAGDPSLIAGLVQGTGSVSGSSFTSSDARDFNLEGAGVQSARLSAAVSTKQSLNGVITYSSSSVSFTSTYDSRFELTPTLEAVAGTYSGQVATSRGVEDASVTISSTGAISGSGGSSCAVSGSVVPRTDGNVYDVSVTFGSAPCHFAGQTLQGIAYLDAPSKSLFAAAPNSARNDGFLFVGVKP